jgi:kynureninase
MLEGVASQYSYFFENNPGRLHFCAHSHHPLPNVTFEAQQTVWKKSAELCDRKWDEYFPSLKHSTERLLKQLLGAPEKLCGIEFASNTHELVFRILSTLRFPSVQYPWKIVCTDSEFHSFSRQMARMQEEKLVELVVVPAAPFETFQERFESQVLQCKNFDAVFMSHVFFNSGWAVKNIQSLFEASGSSCIPIFIVDGYHSAGAIPVKLDALAEHIFYVGGGYKYLQSGEGACFALIPKKYFGARPVYSGWFASFGSLSQTQNENDVPYALGSGCYAGSTLDYSGIARLGAVLNHWQQNQITVESISSYVAKLQRQFLKGLNQNVCALKQSHLVFQPEQLPESLRPRFLAFELATASKLCAELRKHNVDTDVRGNRIRFGFGVYHSEECVERVLKILQRV